MNDFLKGEFLGIFLEVSSELNGSIALSLYHGPFEFTLDIFFIKLQGLRPPSYRRRCRPLEHDPVPLNLTTLLLHPRSTPKRSQELYLAGELLAVLFNRNFPPCFALVSTSPLPSILTSPVSLCFDVKQKKKT